MSARSPPTITAFHSEQASLTRVAVPPLGEQELLYDVIISHFDNGKYWEKAIELLEEMRHQYQHVTFEFALLADLLVRGHSSSHSRRELASG